MATDFRDGMPVHDSVTRLVGEMGSSLTSMRLRELMEGSAIAQRAVYSSSSYSCLNLSGCEAQHKL